MYHRIAIQQGRDPLDRRAPWQWKSTALSSLESLFQVLRRYGPLPQEHLRVFSDPAREGVEARGDDLHRRLHQDSVGRERRSRPRAW